MYVTGAGREHANLDATCQRLTILDEMVVEVARAGRTQWVISASPRAAGIDQGYLQLRRPSRVCVHLGSLISRSAALRQRDRITTAKSHRYY